MRKLMMLVACVGTVMALGSGVASATSPDLSQKMAIGWFYSEAPIGLQIGLAPKMALDLAIGFNKPDEGDTGFNVAGALPITMCNIDDKASFSFRPGIVFQSNPNTGVDSSIIIAADLEARVWLSDKFSILAGHGIHLENVSPAVGDSFTNIGTHAFSATEVGFWYTIK